MQPHRCLTAATPPPKHTHTSPQAEAAEEMTTAAPKPKLTVPKAGLVLKKTAPKVEAEPKEAANEESGWQRR